MPKAPSQNHAETGDVRQEVHQNPANPYPANQLIKKINTAKKPIISKTGDRNDNQRVLTATMHLPQCGQRAGVGADSTPPQSQINRERRFMG